MRNTLTLQKPTRLLYPATFGSSFIRNKKKEKNNNKKETKQKKNKGLFKESTSTLLQCCVDFEKYSTQQRGYILFSQIKKKVSTLKLKPNQNIPHR